MLCGSRGSASLSRPGSSTAAVLQVKRAAIWTTILCLITLLMDASGWLALSGEPSPGLGDATKSPVSRRLEPARNITEAYQECALNALVQEANQVARELGLKGELPVTRTNLVEFFVLPRQGAQSWKAIGKIVTRNYAYYASKDNKFCYVERTHPEEEVARWQRHYLRPISCLDTNGAYYLATQWLAAVSIDVAALNRECELRVQAFTPQGQKQGSNFLPLYTVYWSKGGEGHGSTASVRLFAPTRTLLHLRVEDPKYNLRRPLTVE